MTIGDKILSLRKARGWSQEELAEKVGVTRQAISRWEANSAKPDADKILDICDLFGVSADYLLRDKYNGEGELPVPPPSETAPARTAGIAAFQILGILLIISSVLVFCTLGILSGLAPHTYIKNQIAYRGILGYIMGHHLWWLVWLDVAMLVMGVFLLVGLGPLKEAILRQIEKWKQKQT